MTRLRGRGWMAQVNASSLMGRHGSEVAEAGWALVESGRADLIGSDGHRANRPPWLDEAFAAVSARIGREQAQPLFTGAALHGSGSDFILTPFRPPLRSRLSPHSGTTALRVLHHPIL